LPDESGSTKRPDVISVLGLFTFINCGLFIIVYLFGMFGMLAVGKMPLDEFTKLMEEAGANYMLQEDQQAMLGDIAAILHASGVMLMLIFLLRTVARLIGAIGIWRDRKQGFYIYAGAQLAGLFVPFLVLPLSYLGVFGPLMTVAVTALYGSQLKRMS
jgi:hypothetical protein